MNIKKIVFLSFIGCLFSLAFSSCEKDFDEINKDPDAITEVPSEYLLPGSVLSIANIENSYMESFAYASDWVQHTASGLWPDPGQYNYEKSRSLMWDNMYTGPLKDLDAMHQMAINEGNEGLQAVSQILYTYGFALLSDVFGPIPFSQALQAETGLNKPEYDDQESIYSNMLRMLSDANDILNELDIIEIQEDYDVLFQGDARMWQKFCNALRLRLLIRISNNADVHDDIQDLLKSPDCPLPESNADNIEFPYPATSPLNYFPLYDILSEDATDAGYRISTTLLEYLKSTDDPRLPVYALPNKDGEYVGLENGVSSTSGSIDDFSRINPAFGNKSRPALFITYSEVQFLLAEAAARQLINGDAEAFYNNAIKANFLSLELSNEQYQEFIQGDLTSYSGLNSILMQKWVALFGRGLEAWTEYRRTGIPQLKPANNAFVNAVPSRFLYPLSEEQTNNANLQQAIQRLDNGDALNSKLWWMN